MKLLTLCENGKQIICVLDKSGKNAANINTLGLSRTYVDMNDLIATHTHNDFDALVAFSEKDKIDNVETYDYESSELLAPIPRPLHDIICLGMNYSAHAKEFGSDSPKVPVFFSKRAAVTTGHKGMIESFSSLDEQLDYEVELAVVIGSKCKAVAENDVEKYIFGYMPFNDFSLRNLQSIHQQWFLGKSSDSHAAMGPWIITKDEIPYPPELNLCSRVNGELRQNSNTKLYLHDIPKVISLLSQSITLEAGDIIATGTPSGVGKGYNPPRFLKSGDIVECEIEKVGTLVNTIM